MRDFNFLTATFDELGLADRNELHVTFKIRHTPEFHQGTLSLIGPTAFTIRSEKPIHGVAPGQFCVVYDEQHHRCFGSGEITL